MYTLGEGFMGGAIHLFRIGPSRIQSTNIKESHVHPGRRFYGRGYPLIPNWTIANTRHKYHCTFNDHPPLFLFRLLSLDFEIDVFHIRN
jgi:hypothetical protein